MSTMVAVIVSKCDIGYRIFGEWLFDERYLTLEEARSVGESKRANGLSVIVRPTYNEVDAEGNKFFREWRSFNGNEFHECRWYI